MVLGCLERLRLCSCFLGLFPLKPTIRKGRQERKRKRVRVTKKSVGVEDRNFGLESLRV